MPTTCTPANLVDLGRQVAPMSEKRKKAFLIYGLAKLLSANGGTDYWTDFNSLITAAKAWQPINAAQRPAAVIELVFALAVSDGASISSDVSALANSAKIPENYPDQEILIDFLTCALRNAL